MNRQQKYFAAIGLLFTLLGFLSKGFFREYVRVSGMEDGGVSGWLPSFFYVTGFSLLLLIRTYKYPNATIGVVVLASILFEGMQYRHSGIADVADILASIAGGLLAFFAWRALTKL